jgi:hypothetical protein
MYKLETGDLLLLEPEEVLGKLSAWWSGTRFAHCGIVIQDPEFGLCMLDYNGLCKFENYKGQIWVRKLAFERTLNFSIKFKRMYDKARRTALFPASFVARVYTDLEILPAETRWHTTTLKDLEYDSGNMKLMWLCPVGKEMKIQEYQSPPSSLSSAPFADAI